MRLQGVQPSPISYDKNGKSVLEPTTLDTSSTVDTRWSLWVLGTGLFAKSGALDSLPNYDSTRGDFLSAATIPGTNPSLPVFLAVMKVRTPITPIPGAPNPMRSASALMPPTRQGDFIPTRSSAPPSRATTSIAPLNGPDSNATPARNPPVENFFLSSRSVTIGRSATSLSAQA